MSHPHLPYFVVNIYKVHEIPEHADTNKWVIMMNFPLQEMCGNQSHLMADIIIGPNVEKTYLQDLQPRKTHIDLNVFNNNL